MPPRTFADYFCAQHQIPLDQYESEVFKRVLYRRARFLVWLLTILNRNHFTADHDLIKAVAHLTRLRAFAVEAERFRDHPYNRGILRWTLCMRISTTRLRTLIKMTFLAAGVLPETAPDGGSRPAV
ncbi:MAG: hypothetical protein WC661_10135 [Opitutaceae bacterium]|jgi:hypothetical protein